LLSPEANGRRLNATNLEFRKAKALEEFPARRRRDWKKSSLLMTTSRQAYQLYRNEKRILRRSGAWGMVN